jgi:hypothetical protein
MEDNPGLALCNEFRESLWKAKGGSGPSNRNQGRQIQNAVRISPPCEVRQGVCTDNQKKFRVRKTLSEVPKRVDRVRRSRTT